MEKEALEYLNQPQDREAPMIRRILCSKEPSQEIL